MTTSFQTYEKEFRASISTITVKITGWKKAKDSRLAIEVDSELELMWDTVDSMDKLSRSTYSMEEGRYSSVKDYKKQAAELEELWTSTRGKTRAGARVREILEATSTRIDDIKKLGSENEEIGMTARARLQADREKLEGSLGTMEDMSEDLSVAGSLVGRMSRRALTNKAVLWGVIIVLSLSIVAVVFGKWVYPKMSHTGVTNTTSM